MSAASFWTVRRLQETGSTNDDIKQAALEGAPEGLVVCAASQSAGRGRQGRVWTSPSGNLYVSLLLRPLCAPQEAALYSFVTALALYDTVAALLPEVPLSLKWPNDLLVRGKKISGILLEAAPLSEDGRTAWLAIGAGLNIESHPEAALYPTTCLRAEGGGADVETALALYLDRFAVWRELYQAQGFAPLRAKWLARARKGTLIARLSDERLEGTFADLDAQGRLVLRLENGVLRTISAADVFFI